MRAKRAVDSGALGKRAARARPSDPDKASSGSCITPVVEAACKIGGMMYFLDSRRVTRCSSQAPKPRCVGMLTTPAASGPLGGRSALSRAGKGAIALLLGFAVVGYTCNIVPRQPTRASGTSCSLETQLHQRARRAAKTLRRCNTRSSSCRSERCCPLRPSPAQHLTCACQNEGYGRGP